MKYLYQKGIAPIVLIVGIGALLAVIGGGVGYVSYKSHQDTIAKESAISELQERKMAELEEKIALLQELQASTSQQGTVKQEVSSDVIQAQLDDLRAQNGQLKKEMTTRVTAKPLPLPTPIVTPPVPQPVGQNGMTSSAIIAKVKPSVVSVSTRRRDGSGFLIKGDTVVTNAHVVEYAYRATIGLSNGQSVTGYVVGRDTKNDIAIINISAVNLSTLSFGDSSQNSLKQGDRVYAFGFPFALAGEPSFSEGSLSRRVNENSKEYLEISNSILPGNSGGPLVNSAGDVIGVNSAVYGMMSAGVSIGETIKFSIPGNLAKNITDAQLSSAQTISSKGMSQINAFEDFMSTLNSIDGNIEYVYGFRERYARETNTVVLNQLIASSSAILNRVAILEKNVPVVSFGNLLTSMLDNRKQKANLLTTIYETEVAISKEKNGKNNPTQQIAYLATLDEKLMGIDDLYETFSDQLHSTIEKYMFY